MAKIEKLVERLLSCPADFTWEELLKVLEHFGFEEIKPGKTGGSRRRFSYGNSRFTLHKPHPRSVLKRYMLKQAIDILKEKGKIK